MLGVEHLSTFTTMQNLASSLSVLGRHDEAMSLLCEVLAARERVFGTDRRDSLLTKSQTAYAQRDQKALALLRECCLI